MGALLFRRALSSEKPKQKGENGADQQTGDDRKMKTRIAAVHVDVAGQLSEPSSSETGPNYETESGNDQSGDENQLTRFHSPSITHCCSPRESMVRKKAE